MEVPVRNMRRVGNYKNSFSPEYCEDLGGEQKPVHMLECHSKGNKDEIIQCMMEYSLFTVFRILKDPRE